MDREHEPWPEQVDEQQPANAPERPRETTADRMLGLQRTVGNQAVGDYLARETRTGRPGTAAPPKEQAPTGNYVDLPGIGKIALESVSFGGQQKPPSRTEGGDQQVSEITVTSVMGKHSPLLSKAALDGKSWGEGVEVVLVKEGKAYSRFLLKGVVVSSYTTSPGGGEDAMENWALNFAEMESKFEQQSE